MRSLWLLCVTACWGSSHPAPAPEPQPEPVPAHAWVPTRPARNSCQQTIGGMADKLRPEFQKTGIAEATIDELIEAAIESCRAMDWSTELLSCYDSVTDGTEINACQALMTSEQSEDVSRRMMDVVSRMNQPPPPGP